MKIDCSTTEINREPATVKHGKKLEITSYKAFLLAKSTQIQRHF